jgi:hypothetical protein
MAFDVLFCFDCRWSDSWPFRIRFAFREQQLGKLRPTRRQRPRPVVRPGHSEPLLTVVDRPQRHARDVGLLQDGAGCGYPVASASLSRSGPRAEGKVEHRMR